MPRGWLSVSLSAVLAAVRNWLRYGIQPKNARPGLVPGCCKGKAHDADHLGYAGRRVLASRKWSGKTLADHRANRKQWLLATLGVATDPARYAWEAVAPTEPDHMDYARRLLRVVADRLRWQMALAEARRRAAMPPDGDLPAEGRAARCPRRHVGTSSGPLPLCSFSRWRKPHNA